MSAAFTNIFAIDATIASAYAAGPVAGRGQPSGRVTRRVKGRGHAILRQKYSHRHGFDDHNGSVCK